MNEPTPSDTMKEQLAETQTSNSDMAQVGEVADLADQTLTPQQNRRILIKTNAVVLMIMVFASLLAFLDKVSSFLDPLTTMWRSC